MAHLHALRASPGFEGFNNQLTTWQEGGRAWWAGCAVEWLESPTLQKRTWVWVPAPWWLWGSWETSLYPWGWGIVVRDRSIEPTNKVVLVIPNEGLSMALEDAKCSVNANRPFSQAWENVGDIYPQGQAIPVKKCKLRANNAPGHEESSPAWGQKGV